MTLADLLTLDRPLVWLDVETHAKLPPEKSRICELGFKAFYPDRRAPKVWSHLIDPGVPIDVDATGVHHITDADVFGQPRFSQLAENLAKGFTDCDMGGYNVQFDLRVIASEMARAKVDWSYKDARIVDPLRMWQVSKPRTLSDAVREFCNRAPTSAHRAMGDVEDAVDVATGMLRRFDNLPRTVQALHDLCFPHDPTRIDSEGKFQWVNEKACVSFGKKWYGTPMREVDPDFWRWMLSADFSLEVKRIAEDALRGVYPEPQKKVLASPAQIE